MTVTETSIKKEITSTRKDIKEMFLIQKNITEALQVLHDRVNNLEQIVLDYNAAMNKLLDFLQDKSNDNLDNTDETNENGTNGNV